MLFLNNGDNLLCFYFVELNLAINYSSSSSSKSIELVFLILAFDTSLEPVTPLFNAVDMLGSNSLEF
jgi:hypothetical protein